MAFERYGGTEVLAERALSPRLPRAGELVVRVAAAASNPADLWIRAGRFRRFMRIEMPFVPGYDLAGVVESVGPDVANFAVGDRVVAMQPLIVGGGYATHAIVMARHAAPAPKSAWVEAAALPLAGLTALQGLRDRAGLHEGQRLLVFGAAGGVGHLAVQVGALLGAEVTAMAGARNEAFLRSLGITAFVDRTDAAARATLGDFDVVFDAVAQLKTREALAWLRPGGTFLTVQPVLERFMPDWLAWTRRAKRIRSVFVSPDGAGLSELCRWMDEGKLRPHVEATFPLDEAARAQDRLARGQAQGKLVLIVNEAA